jgi:apolipoprotein N-acyltransferase
MKTKSHSFVYTLLAGILSGCSIVFQSPVLSLVCLVPLLLLFFQTGKLAFTQGFLFAFTISIFLFSWMISGAERFTGSSMLYGLGAFLLSTLFFSAYWGAAIGLWSRFYQAVSTQKLFVKGLLLSACWVVLEELFFLLIHDLPWFGFRAGFGVSSNLLALQYASLGGAALISFLAVLLNCLLAQLLLQKSIKQSWIPVATAVVVALGGWLLLSGFEERVKQTGSIKAVIATQNIDPEEKWDEANGNALAGQLIRLSKTAATHQPQLLVWTESILPWTYQPHDDLTKELLKGAPGAAQLIGMNTEAGQTAVYNSAYYLQPNSKTAAVYHKKQPLAFIEKPLLGVLIPFLSGGGYRVKVGENSTVIDTDFGKAGMMICNESAIPALARSASLDGAEFLVNISNDGWFSDSYLAGAHWQHARLRAVETRKDVVVNSNKGYSGLIQATGKTESPLKEDDPTVVPVTIRKNQNSTVFVQFPFLFVLLCLGISIFYYARFLFIMKKAIAK